MDTQLFYLILIPMVAALIGYSTNWVAIWMLFRPFTEKRIFGMRIPFTPGLIPSQRLEMAQRMGAAVAEHLVTEETVGARLATPEVRAKITEIIEEHAQQLWNRPLGSLSSLIPARLRPDWDDFLASLEERIEGWLARLLSDPQTEEFIRDEIQAQVQKTLQAPLEKLLPDRWLTQLPDRLGNMLAHLTEGQGFEQTVRDYLGDQIKRIFESERPLGEHVSPALREAAYAKLRDSLPLLLEKLAEVLEDDKIKERIKIQIYELIDRLLTQTFKQDSLWGQLKFGLMETFVISAEEIKLKVDRAMEEAAPRLRQLLGQEEMQARIHRALCEAIETFLSKRPADLQLAPETLAQLKEQVGSAVIGAARSPRLQERLVEMVRSKLSDYRRRPLLTILPGLKQAESSEQIADYLLRLLQAPQTRRALVRFIAGRLEMLLDRPIGRPADHLPERYLRQTCAWAAEQTLTAIKRETPRMVATINIEKLVTEQIGSFSVREMEKLVFAVTGQQLKAITWFGALLGLLLGLLQAALLLSGALGH